MNRAHKLMKPFKGFRWARHDSEINLTKELMLGKLNTVNISIQQIDKATGEIIKLWDNAKEIVSTLGINSGSLSRVCSGKLNHAGGFKWQHATDPNLNK